MKRLPVLFFAWGACALLGLCALLAYELTPSKSLSPSEQWPQESKLTLHPNRPTLVVFLHPQCPCSRATVAALDKLVTNYQERFALQIAFVIPPGASDTIEQSALVSAARSLPGANTCLDNDGLEAKRFDANTSGDSRLYGADGRLLFQGGLTASRGHEGDNVNLDRVGALIRGDSRERCAAPVYGCPLF